MTPEQAEALIKAVQTINDSLMMIAGFIIIMAGWIGYMAATGRK